MKLDKTGIFSSSVGSVSSGIAFSTTHWTVKLHQACLGHTKRSFKEPPDGEKSFGFEGDDQEASS